MMVGAAMNMPSSMYGLLLLAKMYSVLMIGPIMMPWRANRKKLFLVSVGVGDSAPL